MRRESVAFRVRRNTELGLVLLAAVLTSGAYALASLGRSASLPANIVPFLVVILGLLAVAHVATRRLAPGADSILLPLGGLLNGIGYVFIARLDPDLAALQAVWTALGVGAFVGALVLIKRVRDLERYRYTFALVGIGLLLMPLLPVIGRNINGSRLWVRFGTVTFQPGEFAKIVLCIFFASYLVEKRELLSEALHRVGAVFVPDLKHFGPVVLAWSVSLVIMIAERDLGSSLLFFALFIAMLWVATGRGAYLAIGGTLFGAGAWIAWSTFAHVKQRITIWLDPWETASGSGYQIVQALFAFAAGGLAGTNLAQGSPQRIPAVSTDFIFAALGEELGLFGSTAVVIALLLMVGTGIRIALRADPPFEKLLATGLTTILAVQSFVILGGVTRLVPLTGITLPFVSYGGSSLLANYVLLALLLRISDDQAAREHAEAVAVQETVG
ncbi:MAG TPA: FtsW/RodA/SpoVE family cell cycle protein [Acidimicrobiales bacterium]|nr:FtsW/RodA/SpoVE family cell cycle protein [Acidimicrobiales bacterium]